MNRRIVYYQGCVVEYFDHQSGAAVVELLEKAGCTVEVPELICCSFPLIHAGEFRVARKRAIELTRVLGRFVGDGFQVVYSCPTCGHALKQAYPQLLNSELAQRVAENTRFISSYLLQLCREGEVEFDFKARPAHLAYHTPCHLRSQGLSTVSAELLSLIPDMDVAHVDKGCCGMGGSWALRSNRRGKIAADVGSALFREIREREPEIVATDCFSCGIQIAQHTQIIPIHPLRVFIDCLK
jgi:glycerol-3-phosphate dehydrogenase subunit C